eukprot:scaffold143458_cov35-Prasinocladus_malaysianus.AAC.1
MIAVAMLIQVRAEAVVFSPNGQTIAYMRGRAAPQIWGLDVSQIYSAGGAELMQQLALRTPESKC